MRISQARSLQHRHNSRQHLLARGSRHDLMINDVNDSSIVTRSNFDNNLRIGPNDHINDYSRLSNELCTDCDKLRYCQFARNLSHNHSAHMTSRQVINGDLLDTFARKPTPNLRGSLPDQHILAEKLKLRYKTCPFHRELSLGLERRTFNGIDAVMAHHFLKTNRLFSPQNFITAPSRYKKTRTMNLIEIARDSACSNGLLKA